MPLLRDEAPEELDKDKKDPENTELVETEFSCDAESVKHEPKSSPVVSNHSPYDRTCVRGKKIAESVFSSVKTVKYCHLCFEMGLQI